MKCFLSRKKWTPGESRFKPQGNWVRLRPDPIQAVLHLESRRDMANAYESTSDSLQFQLPFDVERPQFEVLCPVRKLVECREDLSPEALLRSLEANESAAGVPARSVAAPRSVAAGVFFPSSLLEFYSARSTRWVVNSREQICAHGDEDPNIRAYSR
ncbi:unnamed protein product [Cuscuta campestris]|uniref:Uncharacterized protein n=1 Tax=Cuscuta campestris TaxID=132261 RepID=A0A484LAS6_9ASTE|nr:unnamed protein product [Cuscuta campestris]